MYVLTLPDFEAPELLLYNIVTTAHGPRDNLENRPKEIEDAVFGFPRKKLGVSITEKYRTGYFSVFIISPISCGL